MCCGVRRGNFFVVTGRMKSDKTRWEVGGFNMSLVWGIADTRVNTKLLNNTLHPLQVPCAGAVVAWPVPLGSVSG